MFSGLWNYLFGLEAGVEAPRSPEWAKVRAEHLKIEPACQWCGRSKNLEVHHIWPFAWPGGDKLELVPDNLITLCESPGYNCHLEIGHLGDFKSRNPKVREWVHDRDTRPYPPKF